MNSVRLQDLATIYNQVRAGGPLLDAEGQTEPVVGVNAAAAPAHLGAMALNSQPAVGAGAGQGVVTSFCPIIFPPNNYKMSAVPRAKIGLRVDLTGTLGAYKIAYRIVERRPDQGVGNAARRLGVTSGVYAPKTGAASIGDDPELAPFLPATVTEG
jgi:hypothetical protein